MTNNPTDVSRRKAALTRLAVAMRERLPETKSERDAYFHVYLDGLERFSTDTFERACRRLETSMTWFPKKAELYEACVTVAKYMVERGKPRLALTDGDKPVSPERWSRFRQDVDALVQRKRMP